MNLDILNMKGEKVGVYDLPDTALETEKGSQAVKDTVVSFLNACRAGTASTKTRGEVSGGGRKPFKHMGKNDNASDLLVGMSGIDAQAAVKFHRFVKFGFRVIFDDFGGFFKTVRFGFIVSFYGCFHSFSHRKYSLGTNGPKPSL